MMAKLFEISIPDGMSTVKLNSQNFASVPYTVKHLGPRDVDARAVLIQVPSSPADPNHPVQKGWIKIDGKPERHFAANGEDTFTVNVAVPPKFAQAGTYAYRLDVVSVARPDEGDSSPVLKFEIKVGEKPKPKWGIIIAIIAAVVVIGGIGIWLALRHSNKGVPDLKGMNISDATAALTKANIRIEQPIVTKVGNASDADTVLDQSVVAGTAITKDTSIKLTVGAEIVQVPDLTGMSIAAAGNALGSKNLSVGTTTNLPKDGVSPGIIWQQSPAAGKNAQTNSMVNVTVTPLTVPVPLVTGLDLKGALKTLHDAQLGIPSFSGNLTDSSALTQSVPPGTQVPVGTSITLTFPATSACQPPARCYFPFQSARMMYQKSYVR